MRRTLKFICCLFIMACNVTLYGQPVYTSINYAVPNDTFLVTRYTSALINTLPVSQTGENFNWNFNTMGGSSQAVYRYKTADNSGYRESFVASCILGGGNIFSCYIQWYNLTNQARRIPDNMDLWQFELQNITELEHITTAHLQVSLMGATINLNNVLIPMVITYDAPDVIYHFPLTYNQSDSSLYNFTIDLTPLQQNLVYKAHRKRINQTDGWGSLQTPYATYPNTIRMKTILEYHDTAIYNGIVYPLTFNEIKYQWISPSKGIPVLAFSGYLQFGIPVYSRAEYIDTVRCFNPMVSFVPLPVSPYINPETGFADVHFYNSSTNCNIYNWNFGDSLSAGNISHQSSPDFSYSKQGIYTVKLTGCNTVCSPVKCDSAFFYVVVRDTVHAVADFTMVTDTLCQGETAYFTSLSQNADSLVWIFNNQEYQYGSFVYYQCNETGLLEVKHMAINQYGTDSVIKYIFVNPAPLAIAGIDTTIFKGDTIQLNGTGNENDSFLWSPGRFLSCTQCQSPVAFPDSTCMYYLHTEGVCGIATDSLLITVVDTSSNDIRRITLSGKMIFQDISNTKLQIRLPGRSHYIISIVNILGRNVFFREGQSSDEFTVIETGNLYPGQYFITIKIPSLNHEYYGTFIKQ